MKISDIFWAYHKGSVSTTAYAVERGPVSASPPRRLSITVSNQWRGQGHCFGVPSSFLTLLHGFKLFSRMLLPAFWGPGRLPPIPPPAPTLPELRHCPNYNRSERCIPIKLLVTTSDNSNSYWNCHFMHIK